MSITKIKKVVIREDLLSIVKNYKEAIILHQFIYWSERIEDADKFLERENEIARENGSDEREPFYGWIYKSAEELSDEIMLGLSASQTRKYISNLIDYGFIQKRNNPKYKWDRTLQYKVNLVNIARALKANGYPLSDYKIDIPENNESSIAHQCAINAPQNENQIVSGNEAIPEITTETTIIDYQTENTDNKVFSQEEKTSYNKAFSGEKAYRSPDISYEYTEKEFKEFITKKVDHIVREISPEEYDASVEPISAIIAYFYKRYYKCMGKRHPILTDAAYTKIIMKLIEPVEDIWKRDFRLDKAVYYAMIDQFFKTDYGVKSGNITDYRMSYFMSDTVQSNLVYRSGII